MRLLQALAMSLIISSPPAHAQSEAALRRAFEGTSVVVKVDMPGTSSGVNVYPESSMPVDFPDVAGKLKKYGTALRTGDVVMITKIKVKEDLIEFQLGGGGYGTFGDDMGSSASGATQVGKTSGEKALEDSLKRTASSSEKRRMERRLDDLRATRERENARARAEAAQAEEVREANLRARRTEGGSRFNLRYPNGVPAAAITPEAIRLALSRYVDFPGSHEPVGAAAPAGSATLRKGLTVEEAERLLGPAVTAAESEECALKVMTRTYRKDGQRTTARFVSGVLVEYTITPE